MAEYIDREALIKRLTATGAMCDWGLSLIKDEPAADVRPERHAKWEFIQSENHGNFYVCSECYAIHPFEYKFCHWCGAKMGRKEC